MIKEKKCNGTGKANGHGCGKLIPVSLYGKTNRVYGLGKSCGCYPKWLTTTKEGLEVVQKATIKATKTRVDFNKAKKEYEEEKSLPYLLINVRNSVHRYIKLRDKGKPCISCNAPYKINFQAGHFYKAELYSSLKFLFINIHGQCPKCNIREEGNLNGYAINLPKRIGDVAFKELKRLAMLDGQERFKWDREALYKIREEANKLYNELKKSA